MIVLLDEGVQLTTEPCEAPFAALKALELLEELQGCLPIKGGGVPWAQHGHGAAQWGHAIAPERSVHDGRVANSRLLQHAELAGRTTDSRASTPPGLVLRIVYGDPAGPFSPGGDGSG